MDIYFTLCIKIQYFIEFQYTDKGVSELFPSCVQLFVFSITVSSQHTVFQSYVD